MEASRTAAGAASKMEVPQNKKKKNKNTGNQNTNGAWAYALGNFQERQACERGGARGTTVQTVFMFW